MKKHLTFVLLTLMTLAASCGGRGAATAEDITPGNNFPTKLYWRYGAGDIRIQMYKICSILMDNWYSKIGYDTHTFHKPRVVIADVDNWTGEPISTEMIRDIVEEVIIKDGRFTIVAGDKYDKADLDSWMMRIIDEPKYCDKSQIEPKQVIAPQFLAKVRITKAVATSGPYDYQDYRMTVNLFDIETQVAVDSTSDLLRKRISTNR